jgi:hypothetical protein
MRGPLFILEKRQRPFHQIEELVGIHIGLSQIVPLDAMLPELGVALLELGLALIGHFEAPVAVGCSAADAAFHERSPAFESRPCVYVRKVSRIMDRRQVLWKPRRAQANGRPAFKGTPQR